jgi:hypothetical protein
VKHSSKVSVELLEKVSYPAPNLKAGRGLLSCALKDTVLVEKFLVRESDGLSRIDFLRSVADTGRGTSSMEAGNWGGVGRSHGESISSSSVLGVASGDGDGNGAERSLRKLNGALWGRGEMSMESGTKQGEEERIGGVVTPSHLTGGVVAPSVARVSSW